MRHTFFVSAVTQPREIDVGERKYVRGEWGVAETCDNYCSVMGRGHVHVLPCDPDKCDVGGQASLLEGQRRHARCQYSNGQSASEREPKDELTHDAYWEELGFEDPCSDQQQQEFRLCGAVCGSHAHDQDEAKGAWYMMLCRMFWSSRCLADCRCMTVVDSEDRTKQSPEQLMLPPQTMQVMTCPSVYYPCGMPLTKAQLRKLHDCHPEYK